VISVFRWLNDEERVTPLRCIGVVLLALISQCAPQARSQAQGQQPSSAVRPVGTVKAINGDSITMTTDAGPELNVLVQHSTRILRIAPGQNELQAAAPIKIQDLQVGDRMIIRGSVSADAKSIIASSLLVMSKADIQARHKHEREDWQKRGVGGLVKNVDPANGTITLSTSATGPSKTVTVQVPKNAVVRRYAPDSVKFEDAKPGTLDQIKPGDQVFALGNRNADETEVNAEEIVSGSFQNVAGTVLSIAPGENIIRVMDLATRRPVTVNVTAYSQLKKLPAVLAQRIAARLKGASSDTSSSPAEGDRSPSAQSPRPASGEGVRSRGDLQQMLGRLPNVAISDLQKGDAVMLVATTAGDSLNAITLLTGVEPILTASPNGQGAAMLLSPWNLGSSSGEAASE
jgi:hypothetical protein